MLGRHLVGKYFCLEETLGSLSVCYGLSVSFFSPRVCFLPLTFLGTTDYFFFFFFCCLVFSMFFIFLQPLLIQFLLPQFIALFRFVYLLFSLFLFLPILFLFFIIYHFFIVLPIVRATSNTISSSSVFLRLPFCFFFFFICLLLFSLFLHYNFTYLFCGR